jgi:hypothetical protein
MVAELRMEKIYTFISFEYFVKASWGCVPFIKTSILARGISNLTPSLSGVLVVQK